MGLRAWPLLLALAACGGPTSRPTEPAPVAPSADEPPPDPVLAGTILRIVSGETDAPVAQAHVALNGRTYATDLDGQLTLEEDIFPGTSLEVAAGGFLDRRTLLRSAAELNLSLWPRQSPTGLDEPYTATLVYTDSSQSAAPAGNFPLARLPIGATLVTIVPSAEIRADPDAMAAHEDAVHALSAVGAGHIAYVLGAEHAGVTFETRIDSKDRSCASGIRAFTQVSTRGAEISGGRIVFCAAEVARSTTVTHEMGHTFGLQHSPDRNEIMHAFFVEGRSTAFSPREALAMSLMVQRRPGNRYPDRDPDAAQAGAARMRTIICR